MLVKMGVAVLEARVVVVVVVALVAVVDVVVGAKGGLVVDVLVSGKIEEPSMAIDVALSVETGAN